MNPIERPPVDVDVNAIVSLIDGVLDILGKKWFARRLDKDKLDRDAAKKRNHSRQRVRYSPKHPLVQWYVEYEAWRGVYTEDNDVPISQSVLLLTTFARTLVVVKGAMGLEHILPRLREPGEFVATSFEVEVAAGYVDRGWSVEFVKTGKERSPDLRVTTDHGKAFWAECKYREEMTGRDANISKFWEMLQDKLYRVWGPAKTNVAVKVKSACDPVLTELEGIADAILQSAQVLVNHVERNRLVRIPYPLGNTRAQSDLDAIAVKLQAELSGAQNTRVNYVILSARVFSSEENNGRPALTYRHVSANIAHKNPRLAL